MVRHPSSITDEAQTTARTLLEPVRGLILAARGQVAVSVNRTLTLLNWRIGRRVLSEELDRKRGGYGEQVLRSVGRELELEFGKGFSYSSLTRMVQFAQAFPDETIVATLSHYLSWSHVVTILPVRDPLAREFYAEMCRVEHWSVRTLRRRVAGMLYERTALSKNSEEVIRQELDTLREEDRWSPNLVFRDPYLLDFLALKDTFSEKDLESAILRELESFLLELGTGFSFVARQKRISVGGDDFYLDLLFYHRALRRLIAIELKLESFKPAHTGQMELYLRWLDKEERVVGEEAPIGLILCAGADTEQVELLQLDQKSIRVSEYWTQLPSPRLLQERLHRAIMAARDRAEIASLHHTDPDELLD